MGTTVIMTIATLIATTVILCGLKLSEVISISWLWVTSPLLGVVLIFILGLFLMYAISQAWH